MLQFSHLFVSLLRYTPWIKLLLWLALEQVPCVDNTHHAYNLCRLLLPPSSCVIFKIPHCNIYLFLLALNIGGFEVPLHGPQKIVNLLGISFALVPLWSQEPQSLLKVWH
ncbi:hypothetical protein CISIN_1g033903mg [Citrus sinensis]|uniref:Secreted protein n=1 Tax=Citrus sinensis TaxID=2711 RepID=A0A067DCD7_CITSI|nr:hypothetical protein CISIN_1g033903mg [Citrus sinensis]